jgi:hypothetical protein
MLPASTKQAGQSLAIAPDVCFVPAPMPPAGPGGIPVPFPNMGQHAMAKKTTTTVYVGKKEVLVDGAELPSSSLDEAGCSMNPIPGQKGIISRKNMAKVVFKKHSGTVKFQGKGVITHTAPTMQNQNNAPGMHSVPSQMTVLVGG